MGPSRRCTQQMRYHRRTRIGMSYRTDMNETTSKLFHVGQIDARVAATAAHDRQCRRQLLNQVGRVLTPAPVCGEQQVIVDSGNRRLGAVVFPVRGLRHQAVNYSLERPEV